ncbi:MAG: NAD(+) diphosphatase [Lachnospiraceae bacterium]|nr:NAD(+) diphosphatase [Lachnospiraceae bacterium]
MIQDIAPKKMRNEHTPTPPKEDSRIMIFYHNEILCHIEEEKINYPLYRELKQERTAVFGKELIYLFAIDDITYYLYQISDGLTFGNYAYEKMRRIRTTAPMDELFAGMSAYHLHCWYSANRYCGRCGKEVVLDEKERMLRCPGCGNMIFPRINPVVIVGVYHGDQIIFTKYAGSGHKNYAMIAGFVEFGETLEETVQREVFEEVGIRIKNLQYYKSQPWGLSGSVLMGFFAEADGDLTIKRQEDELAEAFWIKREDIVLDWENISLTIDMMRVFRDKELV